MAPGELYCEVETDKATMGWEAQEEGFVAQVSARDGDGPALLVALGWERE